jgi:hypothetical protein
MKTDIINKSKVLVNWIVLYLLAIAPASAAPACQHFGVSKKNIQAAYSSVLNITCSIISGRAVTWHLYNVTGNSLIKGAGAEIHYAFDIPGKYLAVFYQAPPKDSTQIPDEGPEISSDTSFVEIFSTRMEFDLSHLVLSGSIHKGQPTDKITIIVPAKVTMYNDKEANYAPDTVHTAGIGTHIIAVPSQKNIKLKNGTNLLTYKLRGIASEEAYIMFDFADVNKEVQSYALLKKVE